MARIKVDSATVNQLRWVSTYESLAAFESVATQLPTDEGYIDMLTETTEADNLDTPSVVDEMYRMVSFG